MAGNRRGNKAPRNMLNIGYSVQTGHAPLPILNADQTARLSRAAFDRICSMGRLRERRPNLLLLDIHDSEAHHYAVVSRTIQWASEGTYPPSEGALRAGSRVKIRASGALVPYHPNLRHNDSFYESEEWTHNQTRYDIKVYAFAVATGMTRLQAYARKRLMGIRPIFVAEIRLILSEMGPDGLVYLAKKDSLFAEFVFRHITQAQQQFNDTDDRHLLCESVSAESAGLAIAEQILGEDWRGLLRRLYCRSSEIIPFLLKILEPCTANMNSNPNSAGNGQTPTTSSMGEKPLGKVAVIGAIVRERVVFATKTIDGTLVYAARTARLSSAGNFRVECNQFLILLVDEGETSLVMDETGVVGRIPVNSGTRSVCEFIRANDAPLLKKRRASTEAHSPNSAQRRTPPTAPVATASPSAASPERRASTEAHSPESAQCRLPPTALVATESPSTASPSVDPTHPGQWEEEEDYARTKEM
ncbi:hypothetical protein BST61_g4357 [Cercospora zeina]